MGDGAKLTEIAQRGDNPYHDVSFRTSWDRMSPEPTDEPKWHDTKALFAEIRAEEHTFRVGDHGTEIAESERIQFGKILNSTTAPDAKQERGTKEKELGHER
jgi:hypothetical protein